MVMEPAVKWYRSIGQRRHCCSEVPQPLDALVGDIVLPIPGMTGRRITDSGSPKAGAAAKSKRGLG